MALRTKLRTMVMRTKLVTIIRIAGTRLRMVSSRKNCSAVALSEPAPPNWTLTPGAVMLVPGAAAAPAVHPTRVRLATASARMIRFAALVGLCIVAESAAGGPHFNRECAPDLGSQEYRAVPVILRRNDEGSHVRIGGL